MKVEPITTIFYKKDGVQYRKVIRGHLSPSQVLNVMLAQGIGRTQIVRHEHGKMNVN